MIKYKTLAAFDNNEPSVRSEEIDAGIGDFIKKAGHLAKLGGQNIYHNHLANHHLNKAEHHNKLSDKHFSALKKAQKKGDVGKELYHRSQTTYHNDLAKHHIKQHENHSHMAAKSDAEIAKLTNHHDNKLKGQIADIKKQHAELMSRPPANDNKHKPEKYTTGNGKVKEMGEDGWPKGHEKWSEPAPKGKTPTKKKATAPKKAPVVEPPKKAASKAKKPTASKPENLPVKPIPKLTNKKKGLVKNPVVNKPSVKSRKVV